MTVPLLNETFLQRLSITKTKLSILNSNEVGEKMNLIMFRQFSFSPVDPTRTNLRSSHEMGDTKR